MQVINLFFMLLLGGLSAHASTCNAVKWPYSPQVESIQIKDFNSAHREILFQYLYHELSVPAAQRVPGLAKRLLHYLKNTELNEDRHQMLEAIDWAADLETPRPRVIPLKEICLMESKISREPSSLTKSPGKKSKPFKK